MLFGNIKNGQNFKIVKACCSKNFDFEGKIYMRLAESTVENNIMEQETCSIHTLCSGVIVKLVK